MAKPWTDTLMYCYPMLQIACNSVTAWTATMLLTKAQALITFGHGWWRQIRRRKHIIYPILSKQNKTFFVFVFSTVRKMTCIKQTKILPTGNIWNLDLHFDMLQTLGVGSNSACFIVTSLNHAKLKKNLGVVVIWLSGSKLLEHKNYYRYDYKHCNKICSLSRHSKSKQQKCFKLACHMVKVSNYHFWGQLLCTLNFK